MFDPTSIPRPSDLLVPPTWEPADRSTSDGLTRRLFLELRHGHQLQGRTFLAIMRDRASDDVLYLVHPPGPPLALVHLTWASEAQWPPSPYTLLFADADAWNRYVKTTLSERS